MRDAIRRINVEVPAEYHRMTRIIAAQHDLSIGETLVWALQLLHRYTQGGGTYDVGGVQ